MTDWQIISVVVAIILPLLLFLIQFWMRRKSLSYDIFSQTPLLNIQKKDKWDIQILFDKKPVQNVHLIEIKIFNSGYQEIRPGDYERPISFNFGGSTHILSAEKSEVIPESLQPSIKIEGTEVLLDPILLNPKDSITIKILASQYENRPTPNVRIAGIKDIKDTHKISKNQAIFLAISGMVVGTLGFYSLFKITPPEATFFIIIFSFFLIYSIFGYLFMLLGISKYLQERKKH
jgi:hypothetical protein